MNAVELAKLFTEYAEVKAHLDSLEAAIKNAVLQMGQSQQIAGVKATYYQESAEVDYQAAALAKNPTNEQILVYSTQTTTTRWKELAEALGADLEPFKKPKPARVVVK